jgi:hypothetical protein
MPSILDALATYVSVLDHSAEHTHRAEDRLAYAKHLAAAARMFSAAHTRSFAELKTIVASERRAYGWAFLSDAEGEAAEKAFNEFANLVEREDAI